MTRTLLIDADTLVYESCRSAETEIRWTEDLHTLHSDPKEVIAHFDGAVAELKANLSAERVVMALSDYTDPWRKRVMPTYKGNRKDVRKPLVFAALREYVHSTYDTFQRPGLEGDDVLGILLTNPNLFPGTEKVVVSVDKDMNTLPGLHVTLRPDKSLIVWEPREVTRDAADYYHMLQALTGDSTDGYPGCPGIGKVTAEKLLSAARLSLDGVDPGSFLPELAWPIIVAQYAKKGLSEEVALMNARVARICRHEDYDYQKKEVKLWEPR